MCKKETAVAEWPSDTMCDGEKEEHLDMSESEKRTKDVYSLLTETFRIFSSFFSNLVG